MQTAQGQIIYVTAQANKLNIADLPVIYYVPCSSMSEVGPVVGRLFTYRLWGRRHHVTDFAELHDRVGKLYRLHAFKLVEYIITPSAY